MQGSLGIERMCQLAGVSRAEFIVLCNSGHRWKKWQGDPAIRRMPRSISSATGIGGLCVSCGNRGMVVNHKRVLRILNEDNLLGVWRRARSWRPPIAITSSKSI